MSNKVTYEVSSNSKITQLTFNPLKYLVSREFMQQTIAQMSKYLFSLNNLLQLQIFKKKKVCNLCDPRTNLAFKIMPTFPF